ncbi:drug resistance transporter, EmrB/QacA subfamily [Thermomonospora echinospora]|uniref:Drug resistance transporter, EmrB/QacA subfamily n=1 Tax=Thermomonospora echinospora TaxID=1992 RepID=A0A1H6B5R9_9ACTN|nr:MFS transporter [Thermomonospora echinospora]SEG55970.1 drug resistance transporter, EmrB/QacA subfamily [Thermomonospora echinospora]
MSSTPPGGRSRRLALVLLCAGMMMIILDGTIVTVALPAVQSDLGLSASGLAWVVNAYLIAFGGLLLLAGRLGDLVGRKRVFLAGLALFTLASLLCGLATTPAMLIAARFAQGVGGALASAVSLGMIVLLFPEPRERMRAIGAYSFVGAAGASLGLVAGGVLTDALGWHWIFFVNVPIGVLAGTLAARVLVADRGIGLGRGADVLGALLVTGGLMIGVYAIVETERHGWTSARTLGTGALSLALLAAFVLRQSRAAQPLLPLRVFRSRNVSGANLVQALVVAGMFGFQFVMALYLQRVLGYEAARTGWAMFPIAAVIGVLTLFVTARLIARFGARAVLAAGLLLIAAGLTLLTQVPEDARYVPDLLVPMMLAAAGAGLALPSMAGLGMSGATEQDSGVVSGLFNTTQQIGAALGSATLLTLAAGRADGLRAQGESAAAALTGGYHLAFGIGAGLAALALIVALAVLRTEPAAPTLQPQPEPEPRRVGA